MDALLEQEIKKYTKAHELNGYKENNCGKQFVLGFIETVNISKDDTILDIGCGNAIATLEFINLGYCATGVDIVDARCDKDIPFIHAPAWDLPSIEVDHIFCTDMLEHIPEHKIDDVLDCFQRVCRKGIFLNVATRGDNMGASIGETLHLTVRPLSWWMEKLKTKFNTIHLQDCAGQEFRYTGYSSSGKSL